MGIDQLWEYGTQLESGFKCEFCGEKYAGSSKKFLWHLAKIEGHDINVCPSVVEDVQKEAFSYCNARAKRVSLSLTDECSSIKRPYLTNDAMEIEPMGVQLLMIEPFKKYIKNIWSCLMDDGVSKVGICGVGGVGKTEVAKYMYNHLLQVANKFHNIFWVDVSPYYNIWNKETVTPRCRIHKLQSLISKAVGVDLFDGDEETERAEKLLKALTKKKKSVMILDSVWDCVSLQEVGIPVGKDRCTVVITTRSLEVCRQFDCQRRIDIGCLTLEESYDLYMKTVGNETTLSTLGKIVSKSIANKCGGLPLAITITARNMRGITDVGQMRNAMNGDVRKKVDLEIFEELKLSYYDLKDQTLQHCFLCCPLFIESDRDALLKYLIDEGIIKRMKSRREELHEANTMLEMLENACLLEFDGEGLVKMNVVLERMAVRIMEENQQCAMIIRGVSLDELPNVERWNKDLVRVSLTCSEDIERIPLNYSPTCSKLSTLLLTGNCRLRHISDSFFQGLPGLKVLCLSRTYIESLPLSLFDLVNLTTLLLSYCKKLRKIPSIAKLKALEKLDLFHSGVEQVPDDIQLLSKLKYLDLLKSHVKELRCGVLANFSYLQVLRLTQSSIVKAKELACLRRLETLTCSFTNLVELNNYLMTLEERDMSMILCVQEGESNVQYPCQTVCWGSSDYCKPLGDDLYKHSILCLHNCNNVSGLVDLEHNYQKIVILKCNEERSFCNFSPIKNAYEFMSFCVKECDKIEFLFSLCLAAKGTFEKLEAMDLFKLKHLNRLFCKKGGGVPALPPCGTCFSHLRWFRIKDCPSIKQLFPFDLLSNLKNLEMIHVYNCSLIEEIFVSEGGKEINSICLPKLRGINLVDLPELKSICKVRLICDALKTVNFKGCPKLKMDHVQVYHTRQSLEKVPSSSFF